MSIEYNYYLSGNQEITSTHISDSYINNNETCGMFNSGDITFIVQVGNKVKDEVDVWKFQGDATLKVSLQTSDSLDFSNATTLYSSDIITGTELSKLDKLSAIVSPKVSNFKKYVRAYYEVDGEFTSGTLTSQVVKIL